MNTLKALQIPGQGLQGDLSLSIGPIWDFQSKEIVLNEYAVGAKLPEGSTDISSIVFAVLAAGGLAYGFNPDHSLPSFSLNPALGEHLIYAYLFGQIFSPAVPVESSVEFELVMKQSNNPNATSRFPISVAKFDNKQLNATGGSLLSSFSGGNVAGSLILYIKDPFTDTKASATPSLQPTLEPLQVALNPLRVSGPFDKMEINFLGELNVIFWRLFIAISSSAN